MVAVRRQQPASSYFLFLLPFSFLLLTFSLLLSQPARVQEMLLPVWVRQAVDADCLTGARRMNEQVLAGIDADVGVFLSVLVEEHEVTLLQIGPLHNPRAPHQIQGVMRQVDACSQIAVTDQSAAVEPG